MGKITFIDNDSDSKTEVDINFSIDFLRYACKIPDIFITEIERISNFSSIEEARQKELIFDSQNIILTWSMYSKNHFRSLEQLRLFLVMAGRHCIKNKVYIDSSGELMNGIREILSSEMKYFEEIQSTMDQNYLITSINWEPHRLNICMDIKGRIRFNKKKISLKKLITFSHSG